jgi:peptidoglycan/LPS O-acetylase OafA/YrhL
MSIFSRKEKAIKPLDGIRALACLWIYSLHSSITINYDLLICLGDAYWPLTVFMSSGDLGVDAFFVLSGFLITHNMMKQIDKRGEINKLEFYRSRILRLWPALFCAIVPQIIGSIAFNIKPFNPWKLLSCLLFINNFYDSMPTHYWSVACEFQFYLVSPFLIRHF